MDASRSIQIDKSLSGLNGAELARVAAASLAECDDLACMNQVLSSALSEQAKATPHTMGEGSRLALTTGAGALAGSLRGALGDTYGRLAVGAQALVGLTVGWASKDPDQKAAGMSVLAGASAGAAAIEAFEVSQVIRAKMAVKVELSKPAAVAPGPGK